MTSNPFGRSDLNMELRAVLAARRGVTDAQALRSRLPLLVEHPAVVSHMPETGGRQFQRGLESALAKAIANSEESKRMKLALRWHFALDKADKADIIEPLAGRQKKAYRIAGSATENRYAKDRAGQTLPDLTVALESVEIALDELGREYPHRPTLRIGGVTIPDILVIASCRQGQDLTHNLVLEFEPQPRDERAACAEWPLLAQTVLLDITNEAKATKRHLLNESGLDLVSAEVLEPTSDGRHRYRLGAAPTDYQRWAATANVLDRDLSAHPQLVERLGTTTLRKAWGYSPTRLEDLESLPAPCYMGVCVVVIVGDEIIILERQRSHLVAGAEPITTVKPGKRPAHFVGEGFTPDDWSGEQSPPDSAAYRGCKEELGLLATDIELVPTALVLDTERWQPLFCYVAHCKLTVSKLEVRMKKARYSNETGGGQIMARLPYTITDPATRELLTDKNPSMRLASNHAYVAMLYALAYLEGLERIAEETA